jgi:hypothetical protein
LSISTPIGALTAGHWIVSICLRHQYNNICVALLKFALTLSKVVPNGKLLNDMASRAIRPSSLCGKRLLPPEWSALSGEVVQT